MAWALGTQPRQRPIILERRKPILSLRQLKLMEERIEVAPRQRHMLEKLFHNARAACYLEMEAVDLRSENERWYERLRGAAKVIRQQSKALAATQKRKFRRQRRRRGQ